MAYSENDGLDNRFMGCALYIREFSTCLRGKVGCSIVHSGRIVGIWCNRVPISVRACDHSKTYWNGVTNDRTDTEHGKCVQILHAEMNAIISCANVGIKTAGGIMYVTRRPCKRCSLAIIHAGISRLVYLDSENEGTADESFVEAGLEVKLLHE